MARADTLSEPRQGVAAPPTTEGNPVAQSKVNAAYGQLPLAFEINEGQSDPRVKFLCRGAGYGLFLTGSDTVLALTRVVPKAKPSRAQGITGTAAIRVSGDVLRFKLLRANTRPQVEGTDPLPGKSNYFIGKDPKQWRTNVPQYARVRSKQVYAGIDLIYYGRQRQLEYDFKVLPGANPGAIRFTIEGARKVSINALGDLVLKTAGGDVIEQAPIIYQEIDGKRETIGGGYEVRVIANADSKREESYAVSFHVASYDRTKPLVIDPVLTYSTYLGGSTDESGNGIAVDGSGNAYIAGNTGSTNFPITSGAYQTTLGTTGTANQNAFVTKLNASGSALIYSTYLGGSYADYGDGIAVDGSGNAYITGQTYSTNFPTTNGAFQTTYRNTDSNSNAFVTKLNASGSALVYSTYLGGSISDSGNGIALDGSGNAYVVGITDSRDFPTTAGAFQTALDGTSAYESAFVTKVNASGTALVYSTYLGGNHADEGYGIAVDGSGNAYVTGQTYSTNFPTTKGAFQRTHSAPVAFVTKFNANGSALIYSTDLGGSDGHAFYDSAASIAVDGSGNAYVTGVAASRDFPVTTGAFQTILSGTSTDPYNAFVTKFNPKGSALIYSTFLGGSGGGGNDSEGYFGDSGNGIAVDGFGDAYVTGETSSKNFPVTAGAFQTAIGGSTPVFNAFVTKFNAKGSALIYSTFLGGSGGNKQLYFGDSGSGIAVDGSGTAYVTGGASSTDFPTTAGAFQTTLGGSIGISNAFVACLTIGTSATSSENWTVTPGSGANGTISPNTPQTLASGSNITFTATPASGYVVDLWYLDNKPVQAGEITYTVSDVRESHTVEVTFSLFPGTYEGLLLDGSGYITISLSTDGKFTSKVIIGGVSHSLKGQVSSGGDWQSPGGAPVVVSLQLGGGQGGIPGSYFITGSAGGTTLTAYHAAYTTGKTVPEAGKYTFLLSATDNSAAVPQGTGYGTLTVSKAGSVTTSGKLPDGESFSPSGIMVGGTGGNQFLIYDSLSYPSAAGKKGSLVGSLSFATLSGTSDFNGSLEWIKPQQSKGDYPAGIDTSLNVIGSLYTPPAKGSSALPGFSQGTLMLSDTSGFMVSGTAQLTAANELTVTNPPDNLKVLLTPSTGFFEGTFLYPRQKKPTAFAGVLFQDQVIGEGFFLGPNCSGTVNLTASP